VKRKCKKDLVHGKDASAGYLWISLPRAVIWLLECAGAYNDQADSIKNGLIQVLTPKVI
jgi:hypothetical protein